MKRVAIVGSGISGTSAAYYLKKLGYDVSIFESENYFGGHTNTIHVDIEGQSFPVDTGFLVHNDKTYPNLVDFFEELGITTHISEMSFSVVSRFENIIWSGTNIFTIFAQTKNLFSKRFYNFLREVLHFNNESTKYLAECEGNIEISLGQVLKEKGFSDDFKNWYLLPMAGCIWSSPTNEILKFPACTFFIFCLNHGLLQIFRRPKWRTILNGCNTYVEKALGQIKKKYLNEQVLEVSFTDKKLILVTAKRSESFDYCIMCTHPPQILEIIKNLDTSLKDILKKFRFQKNKAVLHFDESVLPDKRIVWSAWNYFSSRSATGNESISVSYLINKLQPFPFKKSVIVTLNPVSKIDREKIVKELNYQHPLFCAESILAQSKIKKFQGKQRIYFSGAWLRYGFHEDGILNTKRVINQLLEDDGSKNKLLRIL